MKMNMLNLSSPLLFSKCFVRHLEIEVLGVTNVPLPSPPSLCVCLLFNLHPDHSPDHLSFWVTCSGAALAVFISTSIVCVSLCASPSSVSVSHSSQTFPSFLTHFCAPLKT